MSRSGSDDDDCDGSLQAELRHENRISGRVRFASVHLQAPSDERGGSDKWRVSTRRGELQSDAEGVETEADVVEQSAVLGHGGESFATFQFDLALAEFTGLDWAQMHAPDAARHRQPGMFELASEFAAARAAAARSTRKQHKKLAGRSPCSMLSTIAWQLVMQHCDVGDALCLAATCRRLTGDASHAFAWKHAAPRRVRADVLQRCEAEHPSRALLPRLRGVLSRFWFGRAPSEARPSAWVPMHIDAGAASLPKPISISAPDVLPHWARNVVAISLSSALTQSRTYEWRALMQSKQCQATLRSLELHESVQTQHAAELERLLMLLPLIDTLTVSWLHTTLGHSVVAQRNQPRLSFPSLRRIIFNGVLTQRAYDSVMPHALRLLHASTVLELCALDSVGGIVATIASLLPALYPRVSDSHPQGTPPTVRILTATTRSTMPLGEQMNISDAAALFAAHAQLFPAAAASAVHSASAALPSSSSSSSLPLPPPPPFALRMEVVIRDNERVTLTSLQPRTAFLRRFVSAHSALPLHSRAQLSCWMAPLRETSAFVPVQPEWQLTPDSLPEFLELPPQTARRRPNAFHKSKCEYIA